MCTAPGYCYSSPVTVDGKVYIASADGALFVLDCGDALEVLAVNELDGEILATRAVVDGMIYVRTADRLYTFGKGR